MEKGIVVNVRTKVYVHNGDTFFLRVEKSFFPVLRSAAVAYAVRTDQSTSTTY